MLAAFAGLREGELFELRRSDIDASAGVVSVTRKIEKDADREAPGERKDHMSARYLHDRFNAACEPVGLPELRIHGLRHSALTFAGQHGAADHDRMLAEKLGETVASSEAWAGLLKHP